MMRKAILMRTTAASLALLAACSGGSSTTGGPSSAVSSSQSVAGPASVGISARGPGLHRQPGGLPLRVPRTLDLSHVQPEHFAAALGNDPTRIFTYVRDEVAYEAYTGCLRGPRGTLLATAGNSVDRASLLASMLEHAGQKVRYARGTMPDIQARELVTSMWADRPHPTPPKDDGVSPPALKALADRVTAGVKRDYALIRDQLKSANVKIPRDAAPSVDALVREAQNHFWVQWFNNGKWLDLDPSFGDASPGRTYAPVAETFAALPEALFHRVEIRIRLEEYTGEQPASRVTLTYMAKAAELSGVDLMLSHQPEAWTGPATSLQDAMAAVFQDTGRVKAVLIVGEQSVMGEPFRQRPPSGAGIGSIGDLLGGAGTRHAVPVATAESIEFVFSGPDGRKETVVREVFDVVGPARRRLLRTLSAAEVSDRLSERSAIDVTTRICSLLLTTGRIAETHVLGIPPQGPADATDVRTAMRRMSLMFNVTSDGLTAELGESNQARVNFYFDSPRVTILDLSRTPSGDYRLALDLRRNTPRAVALEPQAQTVFFNRIGRGVVDGTLERALTDYAIALAPQGVAHLQMPMSTSALFELAAAQGVSVTALPAARSRLAADIPEDALARLDAETAAGYMAVAPERAVMVDGVPRYGWWRVDPRSGETTAVTDDGLHASEFFLVVIKRADGVRIVAVYYAGVFGNVLFQQFNAETYRGGMAALLSLLRAQGIDRNFR